MKTKWVLFEKRTQPLRWLFLIVALPFLALSLPNEYSTQIYALPGLLCIFQFFVPTLAGWALIFAGFATVVAVYSYAFVADLIQIHSGQGASIFLDADDSVVFVLFYLLLVVATVFLYRARPRVKVKQTNGEQVAQQVAEPDASSCPRFARPLRGAG